MTDKCINGNPKEIFPQILSCAGKLFSGCFVFSFTRKKKLFHHFSYDQKKFFGGEKKKTESHQMKIYLFSPSFHFYREKSFDINIHNKHQHQPANRQLNRNKIEKVYVLLCFIYSFRVISLRFLSIPKSSLFVCVFSEKMKSFINRNCLL